MNALRRWRTLGLIALGYAAGAAGYARLPGGPAYLSEPEFWSRPSIRLLLAFLLPTTAAAIYGAIRVVWLRDPVRDADESFESTYEPILFAVGCFILAMHLMVLGVLTGAGLQSRVALSRALIVIVGFLLVAVGNLLPRTRPNLAIGFRSRRMLENRLLWMRVHRLAGHLAVMLGLLMVLSGALLPKAMMQAVIGWGAFGAAMMFALFFFKRTTTSPAP